MKNKPPFSVPPIQALTESQEHALLEHTRRIDRLAWTIYYLTLRTGLRLSEVLSLELSDVWIQGKVKTALYVRPEIAKRQLPRTLALTERTREILKSYIEDYHPDDRDTGFLFLGAGGPISPRTLQRWIRKHSYDAIGNAIHFHVLRHTFADRLRKTTDLATLQALLGHRRLASTQRYLHPTAGDLKTAVEATFKD